MLKKIRQKLAQIWFFTVWGIPEIWRHKPTKKESKRFIAKCAWLAAMMYSITYNLPKKLGNINENKK